VFQAADAALVRAAAYPRGLSLPAWPDLIVDQPDEWVGWLRQAWALPGFAAAVTQAAPDLTAQIVRAVAGEPSAARGLRRMVEATMRYLLRWTTRTTPFGRFAGVAAIRFGPHAAVRWGDSHEEHTRPDGRVVAELVGRAERDLAALRSVAVVTNSVGYRRAGVWVLPCSRVDGDRIWDVEIGLTDPVRLTVELAESPIAFRDLTARLAETLAAGVGTVERLLARLVAAGVLLSEVRAPVTVTDPVAHLARFVAPPTLDDQAAGDLRLDCSITLPPAVVREACEAAATLVRVAPHLPGWAAYHGAFIDSWGPGAAVPLRDVLRVLGFPAGYRGSRRRDSPEFTARDALLMELAQRCALSDCAEVVLDDALVDRLHGNDDRQPIPHTELRFVLSAGAPQDLDRGAFTLSVVSGARHAGVAAARFLPLLAPDDLARFRAVYTGLPTAQAGADLVQLSGPALDPRLAALTRTPGLLPVLPVGDFHRAPAWTLADLAVAGDGSRLWLVSRSTGRPVEPLLLNAVVLPTAQQPLIRFLTEIWTAFTAPCTPFDWGHARSLPFLPRVRRGRSILHPARWILAAALLPGRTVTWQDWRAAWQQHRDQYRMPRQVLLGDDDTRLCLDLDEPAHLALLRGHLDRHHQAVLTEAPGPAGWIDSRPAELLLTLTRTPSYPPTQARPAHLASLTRHGPDQPCWLDARLRGLIDDILACLAEAPDVLPLGWWFLRHPEPPDPGSHLRLRIPLPDADGFGQAAERLARWAQHLEEQSLLIDYTVATYRPETRHGTGLTLAAAAAVFAADSRAVLFRLGGDRHATTAAAMIAIADAFAGDGATWIAHHVPHHSGPRLQPDQLSRARRPHRDDALTRALSAYRTFVDNDGLDPDQVLADLLHLHHARAIGVDSNSERHCLRLARAVAHADLCRRP
jgi:thiopeptide-type bacteriocin biosynthesis protein